MGMHTGEAAITGSGWVGLVLHETAPCTEYMLSEEMSKTWPP